MAETSGVFMVIPCFRESRRIGVFLRDIIDCFAENDPVRFLLVEDGSGPEEQAAFMSAVAPLIAGRTLFLEPLLLPRNLGKGGAVYEGWARHQEQTWLGFVDADGACPAREVRRLALLALGSALPDAGSGCASAAPAACEAFFASRVKMLGRSVERNLPRHLIGRVYATLVSESQNIEVYDSQCGLKLARREAWQTLRPCLRQTGFAFDVELLAALVDAGVRVCEVPIDWHEVPGGKVRLIRDSWRMFCEVLAIRRQRSTAQWRHCANELRRVAQTWRA